MTKRTKFEKRRDYVNIKFGNLTRNKSLSLKEKSKILKRLWKEAKRRYK